MKAKKIFGMLTLASLTVLSLAACGGGNTSSSGDNGSKGAKTEAVKLATKAKNTKKAKEGGKLEVAVVMDTPFKGVFSEQFSKDAYDSTFMEPSHQEIFDHDENFKIIEGGPADLKLDIDAKTATITIRKDLKWSDGQEVVADDVIFPYEVIGSKDYDGVRYDSNFQNIVGMDEFHAGTASTISGIEKVDDKTVKITYKEMNPSMQQMAGGVWSYAMPKHQFDGIAVKDMEASDAVRKNPVSFGPYMMTNIVSGESVEYKPNPYYYQGKPKLDSIVFKSISSAASIKAMEAKQYDLFLSMPTDTYPSYKSVDGYEVLGRPEMSYTYIGFKLGKWDAAKNQVVTDPNAKMADKSLRQAMGYAIDNDAVGSKFYNGLRSNANTLIPPVFKNLFDTSIKGYTYNVKKAKKLLDDAGYKDTNKDGIREDKNGKELTIHFASMSGGETAQPLADYYKQCWKEIGLKVEYTTGRLIDFQAFYDKLENDDPEIDVFQAAWSTGTDPNPNGLWGKDAKFNYTRFSSEENDKLLAAIDSTESMDADKQEQNYHKWEKYAFEEAFAIPTLFRNETLPISTRVTNWDWSYKVPSNADMWYKAGVTADKR